MVTWTDRPAMTIAVDLGRKATKPTNQPLYQYFQTWADNIMQNTASKKGITVFKIFILGGLSSDIRSEI